jgi:hypothetical protein
MEIPAFQRILTAFADAPADIDVARGKLLVEIRDELIEAYIVTRSGLLMVTENDDTLSAEDWIIKRIARLPLLADRILTHVPEERAFVSPSGAMLDRLDDSPLDEDIPLDDAATSLLTILGSRPAAVASVIYLTSDAGEGKTTLIHHLARRQAQLYKAKKQDWLLVPVSLGGRTFMRFDDVIVGALVNRLRFPMLYYDAFIELVRLGVLIPALDGFEEMFVEGSAGDAMSALGNLVAILKSSGTLLISARKAYFEYKSLQAKTRLLDTLGGQFVSFAKVGINRWDRSRFIQYADKRGVPNGREIYEEFAMKLGNEHPLLTRAVLVKRLLKVAGEVSERKKVIDDIESNPDDYFRQFIGAIIAREVEDKWLDKAGDVAQPLISHEEHYDLLAAVALEMWSSETESLPADTLDLVAEVFSDSKRKNKVITHQIIERLKQHALIVRADHNRFGFDHEEFYHYFLGEAIGSLLVQKDIPVIKHAFRQGVLPNLSVDVAARCAIRRGTTPVQLVDTLGAICSTEPRASFIRDNSGGVIIRFVEYAGGQPVTVRHASVPPRSLAGRRFSDVGFEDCYFQATSLDHASLIRCRFSRCEFEEMEVGENTLVNETVLEDCVCRAVIPVHGETPVFAPEAVRHILRQTGFNLQFAAPAPPEGEPVESDEELVLVERMLRAFMRATGVTENTFQRRLGARSAKFFKDVLPRLEEAGVVIEIPFQGGGSQRRYRLGMSYERLTELIEGCDGRFEEFLRLALTGAR